MSKATRTAFELLDEEALTRDESDKPLSRPLEIFDAYCHFV